MNDVIPLRGRITHDDRAARVGMIVFIGGWTMMFGAVLVAYLLLRQDAPAWPPVGVPLFERGLPTAATAVLLASSATMQLGLHAIREARPRALVAYLGATLALALAYLALQLASWLHMMHRGLDATASLYAASFYGLGMLHALHVVVGAIGLGMLMPRALRGAFSAHKHTAVRSWTLYWHFVAVAWLAFFAAVSA